MRSTLSLTLFAVSIAAAAVACSGGSGSGDDDASSSGGANSSSSGATSGGASSSGQASSSGAASSSSSSSSGEPVPAGKPGAACEGVSDCDDRVCVEHTCREGTATDGVKNGNESGVDCGASGSGTDTHAPVCATGAGCKLASDCLEKSCDGSTCLAPTRADGIQNGNESGVDCGSSAAGPDTGAAKCADTVTCGAAMDCSSGVCSSGVCQVPSNGDGVKNGNETDIDCGSGPIGDGIVDTGAPACGTQKACVGDTDCESLVCSGEMCQAATCIDTKKNGHETDLNCGGDECAPCADHLGCALPRDCHSQVCTDLACTPPSNGDGVKNGNETDIDCGTSTPLEADTSAPTCRDTRTCIADVDCHSGKCTGGLCAVPSKNDGVKNGNETDVDCGSGTPIVLDPVYGATVDTGASSCGTASHCLGASDCTNGVCSALVCQAPSFTDAVKNGNETDLDCGGDAYSLGAPSARGPGTTPQANRCVADKICVVDEDCKSDACSGGVCLLARSCAMHHGGDTCGTGDETWPASAGEPPLYSIRKKHESCCTSIPVTRAGVTVMMDKYPITAGRMRRFLETLANFPVTANLDAANVKAWVNAAAPLNASNQRLQAAASVMDVTQLPIANEAMYPTSWNTPVAADNTCGQNGNLPCNYGWAAHLGGFRYNLEPGGAGGYGCQIATGANGSRTFYFPDAPGPGAANRYRNFNGESQHLVSKDRLDQKQLDCVNLIMLSAFCAWDGGRIETKEEHLAAYGGGTFPWNPTTAPDNTVKPLGFTFPNSGQGTGPGWAGGNADATNLVRFLRANWFWDYSNAIINDRWYFVAGRAQSSLNAYESTENADLGKDESVLVAPPGRFPAGAGPLGHRDLAGNMMEITSDGRWSKNGSFEGGAHTNLDTGGYDGFAFTNRAKYGRAGGRCVRPASGYSAQQIPRR